MDGVRGETQPARGEEWPLASQRRLGTHIRVYFRRLFQYHSRRLRSLASESYRIARLVFFCTACSLLISHPPAAIHDRFIVYKETSSPVHALHGCSSHFICGVPVKLFFVPRCVWNRGERRQGREEKNRLIVLIRVGGFTGLRGQTEASAVRPPRRSERFHASSTLARPCTKRPGRRQSRPGLGAPGSRIVDTSDCCRLLGVNFFYSLYNPKSLENSAREELSLGDCTPREQAPGAALGAFARSLT